MRRQKTVIDKDLSRFGRNFIDVSDYLEQVFPFLNVRFVSVNDGFDSKNYNSMTAGMDGAFHNLIYGYYSKDLSVKVKSAKKHKMEKGHYLSPYAPFGYRKAESNKNLLVVDEDAASIVRRIFQMTIDGFERVQIVRIFNQENIPTPMLYKKAHE